MNAIATKACTRCRVDLPVTAFAQWMDKGRVRFVSHCRACDRERHRQAYASDTERFKRNYRNKVDKDPERMRAWWRAKAAVRRECPQYRLRNAIGPRLNQLVRGGKGGERLESLLGYSIPELQQHLERQFAKGMTWDNYGEWHIDHIVPLSSFSISDVHDPELRRAWALPNLRPLWAADNFAKKDKREHLL